MSVSEEGRTFDSLHPHEYTCNSDLEIRGRKQLREGDQTLSFFAYTQKIDTVQSFIAALFSPEKLALPS